MKVQIRWFAAASDAAGAEQESITVPQGTSIADTLSIAADGRERLGRITQISTLLVNGQATHDRSQQILEPTTIDVLPPFAGG